MQVQYSYIKEPSTDVIVLKVKIQTFTIYFRIPLIDKVMFSPKQSAALKRGLVKVILPSSASHLIQTPGRTRRIEIAKKDRIFHRMLTSTLSDHDQSLQQVPRFNSWSSGQKYVSLIMSLSFNRIRFCLHSPANWIVRVALVYTLTF